MFITVQFSQNICKMMIQTSCVSCFRQLQNNGKPFHLFHLLQQYLDSTDIVCLVPLERAEDNVPCFRELQTLCRVSESYRHCSLFQRAKDIVPCFRELQTLCCVSESYRHCVLFQGAKDIVPCFRELKTLCHVSESYKRMANRSTCSACCCSTTSQSSALTWTLAELHLTPTSLPGYASVWGCGGVCCLGGGGGEGGVV